MRFLSLFSGIEAASVAWIPLGWTCVGVAEIEPFPCSVLAHLYPNTRNLGDITKITAADIQALGRIDLIVGGFPCQDLSVAGKRKGLRNADGSVTRSGLFFDAMRLVRLAQEHGDLRWLLIENVPGLYSSNGGSDFAELVGEVLGCGFDVPSDGWRNTGVACGPNGQIEWATLDAQWFGVAQRRKRVFALADFGDWTSRGPVLFEPASLRENSAPRCQTGQDVTGTLSARATAGVGFGTDFECSGGVIATQPYTLAIRGRNGGSDLEYRQDGTANALLTPTGGRSGMGIGAIAFSCKDHGADASDLAPTLRAMAHAGSHANGGGQVAIAERSGVRRLTPRECERLMGFPDNYTAVLHRGKPAADGPRYRALGNSMAVPCMAWIGRRIAEVDSAA